MTTTETPMYYRVVLKTYFNGFKIEKMERKK